MTVVASARFTFDLRVERFDSRWVPFSYRLTWCKRRNPQDAAWLEDSIACLSEMGGLPGAERMQVGDVWYFRITATLEGTRDYFGEYDETVEVHRSRCFKKTPPMKGIHRD